MALRRTTSRASATLSPHDVYSLTCSCGEILSGERDTCPMVLECPRCSESLYVLPKDVYPRPKVLQQAPEMPDELEVLESHNPLTIEQIEDDNKRLAEPKDDTPPRVWIDRPRGALVRKRLLQVSALIIVALLATWWGVARRTMRTKAEATFFSQSEATWEFIGNAEWDEAMHASKDAVKAADWLGRKDPAANEIRDLHAELVILDDLSSMSLIDIVLEKREEGESPEKWKSLFSIRHQGRWLLLEGTIVRQVRKTKETSYRFDYPLNLGDRQIGLVWDEPVAAFDRLDWDKDRRNAFIAVSMHDVRFDEDDPDSWSIVLSSKEVRLWTNPILLTEALGLDLVSEEAEPLRKLLDSQVPADRTEKTGGENAPLVENPSRPTADLLLGGVP